MPAELAACPNFHDHTPAPTGYIQWHAWAAKMSKTHKQERCKGCGLLAIWVPKKTRDGVGNDNDGREDGAP